MHAYAFIAINKNNRQAKKYFQCYSQVQNDIILIINGKNRTYSTRNFWAHIHVYGMDKSLVHIDAIFSSW